MPSDITTVIVNYRTPQLLKSCVISLFKYYPGMRLVLVDNNSDNESKRYIADVAGQDNVTAIFLDTNVGHGRGMNLVVKEAVSTPYFFTLDTDSTLINGGFLEMMLGEFDSKPDLYAVGWLRWVNEVGVSGMAPGRGTAYIHPHAALFDKAKYATLSPFEHHGAPCLANMRAAKNKGYKVLGFPIQNYVKHAGAGTRQMWGGAWDVRDKPPTSKWKKDRTYPV